MNDQFESKIIDLYVACRTQARGASRSSALENSEEPNFVILCGNRPLLFRAFPLLRSEHLTSVILNHPAVVIVGIGPVLFRGSLKMSRSFRTRTLQTLQHGQEYQQTQTNSVYDENTKAKTLQKLEKPVNTDKRCYC